MKKRNVVCLFAMAAVLMTGCVDAMPDLTSDQSDIISEYAAGLLLKYSPYYDYKLVDDEAVAAAVEAEQKETETDIEAETADTATETESEVTESVPETSYEDESQSQTEESESGQDNAEAVSAQGTDLAAKLGISDIVIDYDSYELCDSYPNNNSGFTVSAAQGRKLLVVHFKIENQNDESVECNLFDSNLKIRITVNESSSYSALSTLLPNDIATYMDTVEAKGTDEAVAVFEVDDISEDEIESLEMQMSSGTGSIAVNIR